MAEPLLLLTEVTHWFGGLKAVDGCSLEVGAGELVGLIGPNGAGKTTLFNLITGVYRPTRGSIRFRAEEVTGLPPHAVTTRGIARTFQTIRLFANLSVLDNVGIAQHGRLGYGLAASLVRSRLLRARERAIAARAGDLLCRFGLEGRAQDLASSLPYGDQRRLEIARALATEPTLLLLDEPAAGMNPAEAAHLMDLIRRVRDEFRCAILLIEHQMKVVMGICERIAVLDFGVKIAEGPPGAIRDDPRVRAAYLGEEA